jgi:uncharacterized delta-60 repeat protein
MKTTFTTFITVLIVLCGNAFGQAPGTIDLTFGTGGKVVYDRDQTDVYNDVQVQPDGKIVAVGTSMTPTYSAVIEVTRYLPDGTFDVSFGTNGHFSYTYNGNPETMAYRAVIKTNGKILIAGHTTNYTTWGIVLIQLNSDGTPDPAFGTNGIVYQNLSVGENIAFGLTLQTDNKILVSGYKMDANSTSIPFVARFSIAGAPDASFGVGGVAEIPVVTGDNDFSAVCVQADGKILAAGHYNSGLSWFTLLTARFTTNGTLDPTYGNGGIVNMNLDNVDDEFFDMKMSGTDCILTGFTVSQADLKYHLLVMKFDQNGMPVTTFGNNGKVIWGTADYTFGDALQIQSDGKIVIAGCTGGLPPANNDWALWRFNADGSLDNTFGTAGLTTTEFSGGADEALGVALWQDKIIVAGKARNASNYLDFALARFWNSFTAAFTANTNTVCNGGSVQFTDQSLGSPTTWDWTFEGGTPSTSNLQNPLVTYATPGVYDVTLHISNGTLNNTFSNPNLIHVESLITAAPSTPSGPTAICGSFSYTYTTTPVPGATAYSWTVSPTSAGTITGTDLTGTLNASNTWNGDYTVKVSSGNSCGTGPVSPELNCTLYHQPVVYSLFSGGGYCAGEPGYEIKLEDSDPGVDYQLYKDGVAYGSPVPGTGNSLSFGDQTAGTYTVDATNGFCYATMQGSAVVFIIDPVATGNQPAGPVSMCNNVPGTYTSTLPANGYSLVWTVTPSNAGIITQPSTTTATITWNAGFAGPADITVQGENECGTGAASPALTVTVNALPTPLAEGIETVCKNQEIDYSTASNTGSSYAWDVTGGSITSGQGSNEITVLWGNPGTGTVSVTETSAASCIATSPLLSVAINECTDINETAAALLTIYPNPAQEQLNVVLGSSIKLRVKITIYNHLGQLVYQSAELNPATASTVKINVANLNPGTYNLRVAGENETYNKIFVKK